MSESFPAQGRLAGIDYGTRRIGIALCDEARILASPWGVYEPASEEEDATFFRELVRSERIVGFVVGLPVFHSGDESPLSQAARRFGDWLGKTTGIPVCYVDERFTSVEAEQLLRPAGLTRKRRKGRIDALAAQLILTHYLESPGRATDKPQSLD